MNENHEWLKDLRIKAGYSQEEIAEKCKISRSYYSYIERGKKKPQVEIAKLLGKELKFNWTNLYEEPSDNCEKTSLCSHEVVRLF